MIESAWQVEREDLKRRTRIYTAPLPKKKQRTTARAERSGPVHTFTKEEIEEYQRRSLNK